MRINFGPKTYLLKTCKTDNRLVNVAAISCKKTKLIYVSRESFLTCLIEGRMDKCIIGIKMATNSRWPLIRVGGGAVNTMIGLKKAILKWDICGTFENSSHKKFLSIFV